MKLREALSFFSRLPAGGTVSPCEVKGLFLCFPLVGLVIGLIVALVMGIAGFFLPSFFIGIIGCMTWLILTRGANLQGVADCGDRLFAPLSEKQLKHVAVHHGVSTSATSVCEKKTQEEDVPSEGVESVAPLKSSCCSAKKGGHGHLSRIGVYGFVALFFVLVTKTFALTLLATYYDVGFKYDDLVQLIFVCMGAAMFARCVAFFATLMPTAKQEGFVYELAKPLFDFHYAVIGVIAFIICYFSGYSAFFMLVACGAFTGYILVVAKKRLGGITENVLACITEASECLALVAFCLYF